MVPISAIEKGDYVLTSTEAESIPTMLVGNVFHAEPVNYFNISTSYNYVLLTAHHFVFAKRGSTPELVKSQDLDLHTWVQSATEFDKIREISQFMDTAGYTLATDQGSILIAGDSDLLISTICGTFVLSGNAWDDLKTWQNNHLGV